MEANRCTHRDCFRLETSRTFTATAGWRINTSRAIALAYSRPSSSCNVYQCLTLSASAFAMWWTRINRCQRSTTIWTFCTWTQKGSPWLSHRLTPNVRSVAPCIPVARLSRTLLVPTTKTGTPALEPGKRACLVWLRSRASRPGTRRMRCTPV